MGFGDSQFMFLILNFKNLKPLFDFLSVSSTLLEFGFGLSAKLFVVFNHIDLLLEGGHLDFDFDGSLLELGVDKGLRCGDVRLKSLKISLDAELATSVYI
jgi:hypothetical protein